MEMSGRSILFLYILTSHLQNMIGHVQWYDNINTNINIYILKNAKM